MQTGMYWHCRHKLLCEWCYDEEGRHAYINEHKPECERELRNRLFKPVKGELPAEFVEAWKARVEAWKARDEACNARAEAWKACDETNNAYAEACNAYDEVNKACVEAWKACDETNNAYDEAFVNHQEAIEALHAKECPGCPWDGETIFPRKDNE